MLCAARPSRPSSATALLGVGEVRVERGLDAASVPLSSAFCADGISCRVEHVDHGLVIRDLVVDVGLVELGAVELLELRAVVGAAGREALARVGSLPA